MLTRARSGHVLMAYATMFESVYSSECESVPFACHLALLPLSAIKIFSINVFY
jgi:hypothetical protein